MIRPIADLLHTEDTAHAVFAAAWEVAIEEICNDPDFSYNGAVADMNDLVENVATVVNDWSACDLSNIFEFIGNGSFKECYDAGIDGWIIKFVSDFNETHLEKEILRLSLDWGIEDLFLRSLYVPLPVPIPLYHVENDERTSICSDPECSECNAERGAVVANMIILQRRVRQQSDIPHFNMKNYDEDRYNQEPLVRDSGNIIPYERATDLRVDIRDWLQAVICYHGDKTFNRFNAFCETFHLHDLHAGNIGYLERGNLMLPVIIDWLSSDNPKDYLQ